ncbi:MAG: hypothetical protein AB7S38_32855 [Vulcanimicrobiota bacterium]
MKLDQALYERACKVAATAGFSSVEEFVNHLVERELDRLGLDEELASDQLRERLRGLGYL